MTQLLAHAGKDFRQAQNPDGCPRLDDEQVAESPLQHARDGFLDGSIGLDVLSYSL
jgi:hypothetical protein